MPDYTNSKIYKIVDNINGNIYIGSTTKKYLSSRLSEHVADVKRYEKGTLNLCSSSIVLKNGDYNMVLVESYPCETKDQLRFRERYWIDNTPKCVNIQKSIRTPYEKNIGDHKLYYENNKERILYNNQMYRQNTYTCECGKVLKNGSVKSRHIKTKKHMDSIKIV